MLSRYRPPWYCEPMRKPAAKYWRFALTAYALTALATLIAWVAPPLRVEHPATAYTLLFVTMTFSGIAAAPHAVRANWWRTIVYGIAAGLMLQACVLLAGYTAMLLFPVSMWVFHAGAVQLAILAIASALLLIGLWPIWRWLAPREV